MLQRLKRFWKLTQKDPKIIEKLEQLTEDDLAHIPEIGDGNAVFFGAGTEEEFNDLKKEDEGMKHWYDRLRNM